MAKKLALYAFGVSLGFLFCFAPAASAQQVFGNIVGTITDSTGAAVNNAKVTITDPAKGVSFVVTTDASGNYVKGQLIPDAYKVTVEAPGFQKAVSNDIEVHVDEVARFDTALKVGDVTTEVEVTAAAPLLQSDRADVAQTFTTKQINDLPNIGRNLQSMELLQPGSAKLGWQHASDENPQGSVQMVTNGQLFSAMGYELDGTTNQDPILGIIVINPTFDALSEMKQANQNFDAEFSYVGGGTASYSTKSGSNDLHGDAFEYLQLNTPGFTTSAANPFAGGLPAALFRENQFGGSIGGKIIKDKLFFFGDAQLVREAQGGSVLTSVPTAMNRNGDFSDWLANNSTYQIYDPNTGNANGTGRTPYPNNTLPTGQLSPQALAIMKYFPSPNTQVTPGQPFINNFVTNGDVAITKNQWDTREDYYLNEKNAIFGRYSYFAATEQAPGAFGLLAGGPNFGNYAGSSQSLNQSLAIGWTTTISPTLINEFRFGWMKYHVFDVPNGYGTDPATQAGIPGLNLDKTYTSGMPFFDINAPSNDYRLGYALGVNQCNCPLTQTETQYQGVDNLNKIHGNHSFKFGADIRFAENLRVPSDNHRAGELSFSGNATGVVPTVGASATPGIGLATYELGDVTTFNRFVSSSTNAQERQKRWFWYAQDEWRPTPKVTLTYGMRWEMVFPESVNGPGNGSTLDLSNGLMYVFGVGGVSSHGIQTMNWHNFAPRVGVAYSVTKRTVLRAGYGWGYDLGTFGTTFGHNVTQNPPVLSQQNLNPANNFNDVFNLAQGPPTLVNPTVGSNGTFPLPDKINVKFRPATMTLPTTYLYNASIQHQLTDRIALTASYVGNSTRHGFIGTGQTTNPNEAPFIPNSPNSVTQNRPYYSLYGWSQDLSYYCDCSNQQYSSLQATFKVNALQGWTMQGSYTYQRQYGPGWDPWDSNYYFLYNQAAGQGYSNTLPRQAWIFAQNYDIPFGKGRKYGGDVNKFVDYAVGGWTISGITTYYSGFGFSPNVDSYTGQPNTGPRGRPDMGSGSPFSGAQGNRNQWFVGGIGSAFLDPAANTFGNYPINVLFGPRFIQQDVSLAKTFRLTERFSFQLKADAQNALNHTNLGGPNTDISQTNAGQITSIAGGGVMRLMQFSGTIRF